MSEGVLINREALKERLKSQDVKVWWVAERSGLATKTLQRWVNGRTKRAGLKNLEALASCLDCKTESLILKDTNSELGSASDQIQAAGVIYDRALYTYINKNSRWSLLEKLVRGVYNPNTPPDVAGGLDLSLALAALHQLKLNRALHHAEKSEKAGLRREDAYLVAASNLIKGCAYSMLGKYPEAETALEFALLTHRKLDRKVDIAGTLAILGFNTYMRGQFEKARIISREAINASVIAKNYQFHAIGHLCIGLTYWEKEAFKKAKPSLERALKSASRGNFLKEKCHSALYLAHVLAVEGNWKQSNVLVRTALKEIATLETGNDGVVELTTGKIAVVKGDLKKAKAIFRQGLQKKYSPYTRALLNREIKNLP